MYTDSAGYTMTVDDVLVPNQLPIASNDSYTMSGGSTLSVAAPGLLSNDAGGSGPLTAVLGAGPIHGILNLTNNGGFSYTPTNGYTGAETFTYRANDGVTNSSLATVTITINVNNAPVANDESYSILTNTTLSVAAPGILANDTDAELNLLTAVLAAGPTHGTFSFSSNGAFTYTPTNNYSGADRFTYRANDGLTNSALATVSITVVPVTNLFFENFTRSNDPTNLASPWIVAVGNWSVTGGQLKGGTNAPSSGYGLAYLTNRLSDYVVSAQVQMPTNSYGGGLGGRWDTNTGAHYAAWLYPDNSGGGPNALKLLRFAGASNAAPFVELGRANLGSVGTNFHALKLAFLGSRIAAYLDGTLLVSATDSTITNGGLASADLWTDTLPYVMTVDNVAAQSLVINDTYTVNSGEATTMPAPGILANDTGVYGTNLSASLAVGPTHGALSLNANGSFVYTATNGYSGTDSFTYQSSDGTATLGTGTVTITVTVNTVNTAPTLPAQTNRTIVELSSLNVTNSGSDAESSAGALTYTLVSTNSLGVTNSNVAISAAGVITWTPSEGQGPSTNIFYTRVSDNGSPSFAISNLFTVVVNEVNNAPTLPAQTNRIILPLSSLIVTNTGTDTNVPAATLTYTLTVTNASGVVANASISPSGVITWTPASNQDQTTNVFTTIVSNFNSIAVNSQRLSATNNFTVVVNGRPAVTTNSTSLVVEGCSPANNAIDPGETVTVSFSLKDVGLAPTTNLVVTLLASGGVSSPSGPQAYGALTAGGAAVSQPFTFTANGTCGGTITATLQLQDGSLNLGTVSVPFGLGQLAAVTNENFDSVTAPALPTGWTTSASGAAANWRTTNSQAFSAMNAAYTADATNVSSSELVSPTITLPPGPSILSFWHRFDLEYDTTSGIGYDGGVLEMKIGGGSFSDILAAGGTFVSGGYNRTLSSLYQNPFGGRQAWSGTLTAYTNTVVNLPAGASGQPVQFRWRCGTDSGIGFSGWRLDSITVTSRVCCAGIIQGHHRGPILPIQSSRTIWGGQTLWVFNGAFDDDVPTPTLTYAMVQGPTNATVDSGGVITWTPTSNQAPSSVLFKMAVWDNFVPSIGATNSFMVYVQPTPSGQEPIIKSLSLSSGIATITWSALSNRTYRIQYNNNLRVSNWTTLPPDVVAPGTIVSRTNAVGTNAQRFYRVLLLP
jgi:VCBS repeat-containing protein